MPYLTVDIVNVRFGYGGILFIDGMDIRSTSCQALRRQIGMVFQDTWLFSGTILNNIRYGNKTATET